MYAADFLTKEELQHVRDTVPQRRFSVKAFKENRSWQIRQAALNRANGDLNPEPCPMCKHISVKLGLE